MVVPQPRLTGCTTRNSKKDIKKSCNSGVCPKLYGTSFGLDTTSDDLAVRVLPNPMACAPCSSVPLGSGWGSANA
jgi:hypothetical protein